MCRPCTGECVPICVFTNCICGFCKYDLCFFLDRGNNTVILSHAQCAAQGAPWCYLLSIRWICAYLCFHTLYLWILQIRFVDLGMFFGISQVGVVTWSFRLIINMGLSPLHQPRVIHYLLPQGSYRKSHFKAKDLDEQRLFCMK